MGFGGVDMKYQLYSLSSSEKINDMLNYVIRKSVVLEKKNSISIITQTN